MEAAYAAQFLASAGSARAAVDHLRHRGPVTRLLLGAVAIDEDHASMEAPDAEGELGGGRGVVCVDGGDETAAAAIRERDGVVQIVVAHDRADGAEGLDLVDV